MRGCVIGCHLSEEPVELHAFGCRVAALDEAWSAVHIHQALVVVIVYGGTEEPDVELLGTGVVHILQETPRAAINHLWGAVLYVHTAEADTYMTALPEPCVNIQVINCRKWCLLLGFL